MTVAGRLAGKVALVTGGTSAIGAASVQRLRHEGAAVIFTAPPTSQAQAAALSAETGASYTPQQVADPGSWAQLIEAITEQFGRLDIALAAAGTARGDRSVEELTYADWMELLDSNLTAAMLTAQHALRLMRANPGGASGSILLCAPADAVGGPELHLASWTSRCALSGLARSVALHCAREGLPIRCNTILPGLVESDAVRSAIERAPDPARSRRVR